MVCIAGLFQKQRHKICDCNCMCDFQKSVDGITVPMYDMKEIYTSNGGEMMTSREILTAALKATGKTQAEAARLMGRNPQWLNARLVRCSLRADEFLALMDKIGVDVTFTVRETGASVKEQIKGAGRRIRKMVNRTIYDTAACNALANNFYSDGVHEYIDGRAMELYIDAEGVYFFAEYTENGNGDHITVASPEEAAAFIMKYGTEIQKGPTE